MNKVSTQEIKYNNRVYQRNIQNSNKGQIKNKDERRVKRMDSSFTRRKIF